MYSSSTAVPEEDFKVCMRPLSGRHAVGGFKITTLGRGWICVPGVTRSLGVPGLLHDVAERPLRRASATHLWGVVLVVAAALTRVLAVQIGLSNTCCVIMAEFKAL